MIKPLRIWIFLLLLLFPMGIRSDEIIVTDSELVVRLQAKDGEKGDPGEPGPAGPPGTGGEGAINWINVKAFGAKGDGKTDDTEAFKKAIRVGGTIYIPAGHYVISDTLYIDRVINIRGDGKDCQILQMADKPLLHFKKVDYLYVEGIVLGSQARSSLEKRKAKQGKAVVLLENCHYGNFERVYCYGGDYGFYIKGCLGLNFDSCGQMSAYHFWKLLHSAWAVWYGHAFAGFSVNHTSITNPYVQGGIYGIRIEDTTSQGGITIQGGVIEGMGAGLRQDEAGSIYLSGITNNWSIEGVHCEAYQSGITIRNCKGGSIRNCYVGSDQGIRFSHGYGNELHGGHISGLAVDKTESNFTANGSKYGVGLDIRGGIVGIKNFTWDGGINYGSYGNYTWDGGQKNIIENGDLEAWVDGTPLGFVTCGKLERESNIVLSGRYSAKVTVLASDTRMAGMRMPIYKKKYAIGRHPFTVSCYIYVPSQNGAIPRLGLFLGGYGGSCTCPPFMNVERDKWTPITFTTYSDADNPYLKAIEAVWAVWYNSQPEGSIFYLDELEVIEGMR